MPVARFRPKPRQAHSADASGAVAVSIVEAVEPVTSLVLGRGTSDCRCEHEPQIQLSPRSLPGGSGNRQPSEGGSSATDL